MDINILIFTALSIGFIHTLIGPDHYIPFIILGRARSWSLSKTSLITILCGVGHVLGSVLLGLLGVVVGTSLGIMNIKLDFMEKYIHALAGLIIAISGLSIKIFGL